MAGIITESFWKRIIINHLSVSRRAVCPLVTPALLYIHQCLIHLRTINGNHATLNWPNLKSELRGWIFALVYNALRAACFMAVNQLTWEHSGRLACVAAPHQDLHAPQREARTPACSSSSVCKPPRAQSLRSSSSVLLHLHGCRWSTCALQSLAYCPRAKCWALGTRCDYVGDAKSSG